MKDPATATVSAAAAASAAPVLAGLSHLFGVPTDSLVWGFMGGIVAVLAVPGHPDATAVAASRRRSLLAMASALTAAFLVSVLVAAAMGPLTASYLHIAGIDPAVEVRAFSFLWGAGAQAGLLLTAIEAMRRRIAQLGGNSL